MSGPTPMRLLGRLALHAAHRGDAVAYRFEDERITWRELDLRVRATAGAIAPRVSAGGRVLICSPNRIELAVAILACFAAGADVFPVSCESADAELRALARAAQVVAVIGDGRVAAALRDEVEKFWPIASLPESRHVLALPASGSLILQSSGTTGHPMPVARSACAVDAVAETVARGIGFTIDDRVLSAMPLSHSYGIEHGLLAPVWAGSTVLLQRGFDVERFARHLAAGATLVPTVPSVVERACRLSEMPTRCPEIRAIYTAGSPLPRSIFDEFESRFGLRVAQLYGATEVGSVTFNRETRESQFDPGSVGRPFEGAEVRILGTRDDSHLLCPGQEGQVAIRAASMFDGYLNGNAPLADGFFLTGDLGRLDEHGRLTITGRLKLLIDVGGLKVNPIEVESVLQADPHVGSCVVVPVRQSETVCRIKAIVTPRDPASPPSVEALRQLARARLAKYKVPRVIEVRGTLPTTPTGKVLRHLLAAEGA